MTEQEAFDKVWDHFIVKRRARSVIGTAGRNETCRYRGRGGSKCAVGVLIPDEQYSSALEETDVRNIMQEVPAVSNLDWAFLNELQNCHDFYETRADMKAAFRKLAESRGLQVPR